MGGSPILPEAGLGVGAHALPRADLHPLGSPLPIALGAPDASWLLQLSWKLGPQVGRFGSTVYREGWEAYGTRAEIHLYPSS